jgi:RNA polymerase sigma-70 factor, ECF subfamily
VIAEAPTQTYQNVRPWLFSVAYRMTGSASDAEDLVHDAWIRYLDAGSPAVDSLRAWLTTAISRLALDHLKSARVKREQYTGTWMPEPVLTASVLEGPEATVEQREEVSVALLLLMDRLSPEQRVVYVLREGFGLSYDEIAAHVGKSAATCRQHFRRAHLRLASERQPSIAPAAEHRALAEHLLAAIGTGDAARVASLLTEDAVWEGDGGGQRLAGTRPVVGADRVARGWVGLFRKSARYMTMAYRFVDLNGAPAIAVLNDGALDRVMMIDVRDGRVSAVRTVLALDKLAHLARSLGVEVGEPAEWSIPGRPRPLAPRAAQPAHQARP